MILTIYYTSNDISVGFDAASVGALPASWVAKVGTWQVGTVQVLSGHSHSFGSTSHGDGDVALLTGIAAQADMQISVRQKLTGLVATAAPMMGVLLRMDAAYSNGYAILVDQTGTLGALRLLVFRRAGGGYTFLGASAAIAGITFSGTDVVMLRAQIQGSNISAKLWPLRISEPTTWHYVIADAAITAAGYTGLYNGLDGAGAAVFAVDDVVVSDLPSLSVATPTGVVAGSAMVVSGTYTGQDPAGLNVQFDSAGYVVASGPSIGAGSFALSVAAPSAGAHTVSVQQANDTAVVGTSASFVAATGSLTVATPATVIAGQPMTISGSYAGATPTGFNYRFDSAGYIAASGAVIGGGGYSFTVTAPAVGSHTVSVQEAGATTVTATSGAFAASVGPGDATILYSPYTWDVQAGTATAANAGASFRMLFTGTTCVLNFNVSAMVSPASQIWWRIDNGPWTQAVVAATVTCGVPVATAGNADVPYHLIEVIVKSMTETQNRWNSGSSTRVVFTGVVLANGASTALPSRAPRTILVFGDSITEGVRTLGESALLDTDRNDACMGWARRLADLLGAEVGVVGFGAQGLAVTGSGNVPVVGTSWNFIYAGAARHFSQQPDLVVINIGTNDGGASTAVAMKNLLNGIISACPGKPIVVLRPFNGAQAANLQAAIAACNDPAQCRYVDTAGMFNVAYGADSLGLHPSGPNNVARIAPQIAAAINPVLSPGMQRGFRIGFQQGLL